MAIGYSSTSNELPDWLQPYIIGTNPDGTSANLKGGILGQAMSQLMATPANYDFTADQAIANTQNRIAELQKPQLDAIQETMYMQPSQYLGQGAGLLGMAGTSTYNNAMAQQYMDPYAQNVINQQKKSALQDYKRQLPGLMAAGYQQGAGRGTRNALMQSEANRNLQNNLQNIQATGLQNAWQQGQQQFNAEQNRALQAGTGLGQIGQDYYTQMMGINAAKAAAGATLQAQKQNYLTTNYEDWLSNQRAPWQKLGLVSDIISGVPANAYTSQMYTPNQRPDTAGQKQALYTQALGTLLKG